MLTMALGWLMKREQSQRNALANFLLCGGSWGKYPCHRTYIQIHRCNFESFDEQGDGRYDFLIILRRNQERPKHQLLKH